MKLIDIVICCDKYKEYTKEDIMEDTCPGLYDEILYLDIYNKIYKDNGECRFNSCKKCWNSNIEDLKEEK